MKTIPTTAKLLLLTVFTTATSILFAQSAAEPKAGTQQYRINIVKKENGKKEKIDRTFSSKEEMEAFAKANNIAMPTEDEKAGTNGKMEKTIDKKVIMKGDKKTKKVIIMEKEEGSLNPNPDLDITFTNLSATERAELVQQMLQRKDSKVEIQHVKTTSEVISNDAAKQIASNAKSITIIENGEENTQLGIVFSSFSAKERAQLIQQMLEMKDCQVEIKHTKQANEIKPATENGQTKS